MRVTSSHLETVSPGLRVEQTLSRSWAPVLARTKSRKAGDGYFSNQSLRSPLQITDHQCPGTGPWWNGHWAGLQGLQGLQGLTWLSTQSEAGEQRGDSPLITFIPNPKFCFLNHNFSAPYLFLLYLYLVGCLSHGQAAPPHYFCIVFHCFSLTARWKVSSENHTFYIKLKYRHSKVLWLSIN